MAAPTPSCTCGTCKACKARERRTRHRLAHLDEYRDRNRRWNRKNNSYYRKWAQENKQRRAEINRRYRQRHREKYRAHTILNNALASGKIQKLPCSQCGNPNSQAHHEDYSQPLEVVWLCARHHSELHAA